MKPLAFRIRDFKSIIDSGVCDLSLDNITVLAGQNESGKTSVLQALRDFDQEQLESPITTDFMPDDRYNACPTVSVKFEYKFEDLLSWVKAEGKILPEMVANQLGQRSVLWVKRDLLTGLFSFDSVDKDYLDDWDMEDLRQGQPPQPPSGDSELLDTTEPDAKPKTPIMTREEFLDVLYLNWPSFVYFDTFEDILPRTVDVSSILLKVKAAAAGQVSPPDKIPQSVLDFISLSQIDLDLVKKLEAQDKNLGNYLSDRAALITGDFLNYWKQRGGEETVTLRVRHHRDPSGQPQLAFYVHDRSDQYPEQRSRGFLWFMSFYLRLAAADSRGSKRGRLLLIDEPGTYLHARAQKDVLRLLEDRLAKTNQIIYSTHSVYLLPATHLNRLRIVIRPTKTGTAIVDRLTDPRLRSSEFADTMSPIMNAIGLDVTDAVSIAKERNLIVEGISDYFYLHAWSSLREKRLSDTCNIFPATGAMSTIILASLFIGWGLEFIVLLDRDAMGTAAKDKLISDLGLNEKSILQPKDALGIEDLLSVESFQVLLKHIDDSLACIIREGRARGYWRGENAVKTLVAA